MPRAARLRLLPIASAALLTLGMTCASLAQAASAPPAAGDAETLDTILAALDAHIADYSHSVPSFLCDELVVSILQPTYGMLGFRRTVTDSVFRVRRVMDADNQPRIQESRVVKTIDGKAVAKAGADEVASVDGPMAVFGIFSNGLSMVSTSTKTCFRYQVHLPRKKHPSDKITLEFANLPPKERTAPCLFGDRTSGRATIDPATMRVVRLEAKLQEYELHPGDKETWEWTITYAPVTLGGKTFWLPATIKSTAVPDPTDGTGVTVTSGRRGSSSTLSPQQQPAAFTYSLSAKYTEYHLLNVSSRIIPVTGPEDAPASEAPAPPAASAPAASPRVASPPGDAPPNP